MVYLLVRQLRAIFTVPFVTLIGRISGPVREHMKCQAACARREPVICTAGACIYIAVADGVERLL
jgi:hypothetical protein